MDDHERKKEFESDANRRRDEVNRQIQERKAREKILFKAAVTHDHQEADRALGIPGPVKTGPTSPPRPPFQRTRKQEFIQLATKLEESGLPHHETEPWVSQFRSIDLGDPVQGKATLKLVYNQFTGAHPRYKPAVTMWDSSEASEFSRAMQMVELDFLALEGILD